MRLHAKFDVSSSDQARDMDGSQNFKIRSYDGHMTPSRPVNGGSSVTRYLDFSTPICLFTVYFHGATMTIKGSLQGSIAIVTAFLANFWSKIWMCLVTCE